MSPENAPWYKRRLVVLAFWVASLLLAIAGSAALSYIHNGFLRATVARVKASWPGGTGSPRQVIATSLYNLLAQEVHGPFEGRDGGIAVVRDGVLLATRTGAFWYVSPKSGEARPLGFRIPVDVETFKDAVAGIEGARTETFGVKDIAVREGPGTFRVFATYPHWDAEHACVTLRVAMTELPYDALSPGAVAVGTPEWSTLFETRPCIAKNITSQNFSGLQQSGGRVVALDDSRLLVSAADFFGDGLNGTSYPQDMDSTLGKTILVGLHGEPPRIFSSGHRNPQGLALTADGDIFLTEHGPQGGDELNLVKDGVDYGWPQVTYGTDYGSLEWPFNKVQGRHDGFEEPIYAWVPSVGISNLIGIQSSLFERWRGDLLVASLTGRTLFRVRLVNGRAVVVEPIRVEHRIRDIIEGPDGSVVLKTDDDLVIFLRPISSYTRSSAGTDVVNGQLIATQCSGCHKLTSKGKAGIGPTLVGVIGRRIAAVDGYQYSAALGQLTGTWTPELLREFLRAPDSVASGTTMRFARSFTDQEFADLTAYLATLD